MRLIFTAGGTGGHIYPALSIAAAIMKKLPGTQILFITGMKEMEKKIITGEGYTYKTLPVIGMPRKLSPSIGGFIWKLGISVLKSFSIISGFRPAAVIATGGYVSGPPVMAAAFSGIPVFIQEQNSFPGITTKRLAGKAKRVFLGFSEAEKYYGKSVKITVTGNPVREIIGTGKRQESASFFGLDPEKRTLLVFGGSQGAGAINKAMVDTVEKVAVSGIQIIWQTGVIEFEKYKKYSDGMVKVLPYIDNMNMAYSASDLAVARAGAMTIAELTASGLPAIFIPLPTAAENHQEFNASALLNAGAASLIHERDLNSGILFDRIMGILSSDEKLHSMSKASSNMGRKDAAGVIAEAVLKEIGDK